MSYWKTTIVVEVLSEQPFEFDDLGGVHYAITDGDCSGEFKDISSELITARQMHDALLGQSSCPEFFLSEEELEEINKDIDKESAECES